MTVLFYAYKTFDYCQYLIFILIPPAGYDPARLTSTDFKSVAATNYAKGACV
jgi:hypothetical protein